MSGDLSGENVNAQKVMDTNNADKTNEDKERLVNNMERALELIKKAPVFNKESFVNLGQRFDNFLKYLKELPVGTSFADLPTEIKTQILNYLCDDRAFIVASVSKEWRAILNEKIVSMETVTIGRHCNNGRGCECFNPTEMLKASLTLEMNIPLLICHDVQEVESQLLVKAMTNVSKFTLDDTCDCCEVDMFDEKEKTLLTNKQSEDLMKALEMKNEPMEEVVLKGIDLTYLKDRLLTCLLKKVKTLTLIHDRWEKVLNFSSLVKKLRKKSGGRKLRRLNLHFEYKLRMSPELLADGLATVDTVDLGEYFSFNPAIIKPLISKMSTQVATKTLIIRMSIGWASLITPMELQNLLLNMDKVRLEGVFSQELAEVARALPGGYALPLIGTVASLGKN